MTRLGCSVLAGLLLAACAGSAVKTLPERHTEFAITQPEAKPLDFSAQRGAFLRTANLPDFFDCLRTNGITIPAAHRLGGSGNLENSLEALATTAQLTPPNIPVIAEVDIRQTADGALVVMHDETVDRTTTGTGRVDAMVAEEFKQLTLRHPPGRAQFINPLMLSDLLWLAEDSTILQLDVKRGVAFEDVVNEVQTARAQNRVIVIVYSLADAITVHNLDPSLMLSVQINTQDELDTLRRVGVDLSRVLAWTGTTAPQPALYEALRARGVEVLFGTLGRPGESIDSQIEQNRTPRRYTEIAKAGVTVISTGRYRPAYEALVEDGVGEATRCVGG
jgi:glycerophosphoryl diester phosphodiesterase